MGQDAEFSYPRANLIVSSAGFSVEVRAPSAIRYVEMGRAMDIFAEVLMTPEPKLAVRSGDIRVWEEAGARVDVTESERSRIIENLGRAFAFKRWILVVE